MGQSGPVTDRHVGPIPAGTDSSLEGYKAIRAKVGLPTEEWPPHRAKRSHTKKRRRLEKKLRQFPIGRKLTCDYREPNGFTGWAKVQIVDRWEDKNRYIGLVVTAVVLEVEHAKHKWMVGHLMRLDTRPERSFWSLYSDKLRVRREG